MPDCCVLSVAQEHAGAVNSFGGDLREVAARLRLEALPG